MEADIIVAPQTRFMKRRDRDFASSNRRKDGLKRRRITPGLRGVMVKKSSRAPQGGPRGFYGLNQGNHGVELKDIDTSLAAAECSTTGAINLINGVAQGTDFNTRVGRKFNMRSILVRGTIKVGATPTLAAYRWMIVYDKQANGASAVITDILTAINMGGVNNLTNRDRFVVIADKKGYVEAAGRGVVPIKFYKRCALETTNGGTSAAIGSIQTGALYFVTLGDLATGVTAPVCGAMTARVRFTDT